MPVYIGLTCCVEVFEGVGLALSFGSQCNNYPIGRIMGIVRLAIQIHNIAVFCVMSILLRRRYRKMKTKNPMVPRLLLGMVISMGLSSILSIAYLTKVAFKTSRTVPAPSWFSYGVEEASLLANSLLWNICGWV